MAEVEIVILEEVNELAQSHNSCELQSKDLTQVSQLHSTATTMALR